MREIVSDLTYGARLIRNPDPALQPLIRLTAERYAISPTLFIGINAERNFTVLLNRLPEEKQEYSRLSTRREELSRRKITEQLKSLSFRFWHGEISGRKELPDIDLAIIDDTSRTCLVLELKAFVAPAEPREVLEKSKEIKRGVSQIKTLRDAFSADRDTLERPLAIDNRYAVFFAVASETFIGASTVQDEAVAVVRVSHLVQRLCWGTALSALCHWLYNRNYLPSEGQHYEVKDVLATVGDWRIQWYGIHPLIDAEYS